MADLIVGRLKADDPVHVGLALLVSPDTIQILGTESCFR